MVRIRAGSRMQIMSDETYRNSCDSPDWKFGATMEYMLLKSPEMRE